MYNVLNNINIHMGFRSKLSFFVCHLDFTSRMIRICLGVLTNLGTLYAIESLNALVFWSLILVSYALLLEAFWGMGLLHSALIVVRKDDSCPICVEKK